MGADHVPAITKAVSGAEIRAVADIDPKRAEAAASGVPGAKAFPSAELLIESPEVDAVIIASSDATHAQYVTACISARKPVLCEKPLAPTVAECEEVLRLEEAAAMRLVQVGFMRRFDPGYVELRSRIAAGKSELPCSLTARTATWMCPPDGLPRQRWSAPLRTRSTSCLGFLVGTSFE